MSDTRPLPPNYIAQFDERYKRSFFVNTATGQSSWDDPRPAYYAQQQGGTRGMGGPPPPSYYQQGPPPQQYHQQPPPQQYYQQPPPQQYYQQPPPQQYYQQPPPQQYSQPQTVVVQQQPEQKQSFFKRNPMMTGLAAGAVGMFAAHEIGEHFEEERQEAYDAGFEDGVDANEW